MTILQDILAAVGWQTRVNENFRSVAPAALYGIDPATTTGLTLGYLGGEFGGVTVANGTVALTASQTNYVVANRTTGAVTASTATTNWSDEASYMRLYQLVAGASTFSIGSTSDKRQAIGGASGTGGMSNPMTTTGDIIYSSGGASPARLGVGTNGYVLTVAAGVPTWAAATGGGFANPMTASGDTIYGGASGAPTRLAKGADTQVLTLAGGVPTWATPTSGGMTNPMTTTGDMIVGSSSGAATRLAAGTSTYVLTSNGPGVAPSWSPAPGGGGGLTNFTEAVSTATPNSSVPVVSLTAANAAATVDIALVPKAGGALTAQVANNSTSGGDKRGTGAVDLQMVRSASAQVASGPYATIAGGGANTASGVYAGVSSGNENSATNSYANVAGGYSNAASGQQASVSGGSSNTASGSAAVIAGGTSNVANQGNAFVIGGSTNTVSGTNAGVAGGANNTASGNYSFIAASANATTRGIDYCYAHSAGQFSTLGDSQSCRFVMRRQTTNATATPLTSGGGAPSGTNSIVLPDGSCFSFCARVVARDAGTGNAAAFEIRGAVKRGSGASTVVILGTPTVTAVAADAGAAAWTIAAVANTTLGSLELQATGAASTTIKWVADVETVEVVG